MTSLTAPMRTMNKRPSTQRKKPSRLSLSELNGLHDGWLSLTGKWRLYFGKRCDSGELRISFQNKRMVSFKRGKGEVGMDEYQTRTWHGWHHHMTLSLMTMWF